jgi:hypothetical protein
MSETPAGAESGAENSADFWLKRAGLWWKSVGQTDEEFLRAVRERAFKRGGKGEEFFDHFMSRSGQAKTVDTSRLLAEDRGVRNTAMSKIRAQLDAGQTTGQFVVHQPEYSNDDWCMALGGFTLEWRLASAGPTAPSTGPTQVSTAAAARSTGPTRVSTGATAPSTGPTEVRVWFRDRYKWWPDRDLSTRRIHEAADRLARSGAAAEFDIIGLETSLEVPAKVDRATSSGSPR